MRVLVAHNAYQQRGGEDAVVDAEISLLRKGGHDVDLLMRHNDDIVDMDKADVALQTLWSRRTTSEIREHLDHFKPDVVHVHNTFPLLSPSIYWACSAARVPVVQTLHNFRLACPQAMFLRDGRVCEDCLGKSLLPAIKHGCYRDSRAQTLVLAGMLTVHRSLGTWKTKVSRYIALNEFCRTKFIEAGLPAERIVVKPNFVDAPEPNGMQGRSGFLFVGRLSNEKGVAVLAEAWRILESRPSWNCLSPTLRVAGTGTEAHVLDGLSRTQMLGALPLAQVQRQMAHAQALVLPSIWYENFPRTLVEAMGASLPVIASRIGALAELVREGDTGLLFDPGNGADLARVMEWAQMHPDEMARMGQRARSEYESKYSPEINLRELIDIYEKSRNHVQFCS